MTEQPNSGSQIYLVVEAGPTAVDRLTAAFQAVRVASVLIVAPTDATLDAGLAHPLVEFIQQRDIAALIDDDAALARASRADGVHLSPSKDCLARYEEARDILGTRYIVGAHAGKSRDTAMLLGEVEADYIAFGSPAFVQDRNAAEARRLELVSWWSEIFEVPCVAMDVETPAAARELAAAHAEFIAVTLPAAVSTGDVADQLRSIQQELTNQVAEDAAAEMSTPTSTAS